MLPRELVQYKNKLIRIYGICCFYNIFWKQKNICFNTYIYIYTFYFISIVVYYNLSNTNICMLLILV